MTISQSASKKEFTYMMPRLGLLDFPHMLMSDTAACRDAQSGWVANFVEVVKNDN